MRLTKATALKIELPAGKVEKIFFDDGLKGFGLRIRAGGKKSWICQYRVGAKQRRLALGQVDAVDADEARRRAKAALARVSLGEDPAETKLEELEARKVTIKALLPQYLAWTRSRVGQQHLRLIALYLGRDWKALENHPLTSIDRAKVSAQFPVIAREQTDIVANRSRALLSGFFKWAVAEGHAPLNPVQGTNKPFVEMSRERVLSDDELRLMWQNAGTGDFGTIVKLLALTATRKGEAAAMRRSELNGSAWMLPGKRSKNRLSLLLDLPTTAMSLLASTPHRDGRDLFFGMRGPFSGFAKSKSRLDARMLAQLKLEKGPEAEIPHWVLHDIRRTVATGMADLGVAPHIIECVLNHVGGFRSGVAGIYNKALYRQEKKEALEKWEAHLMKIVNAEPRR